MKTVIGPAGWYCDNRPDFGYVFLVRDSHLETHAGRVELPDRQNLLYIDIAPTGNRFAGVGHRDDQAWEWNGDEWICHGRAIGPRAVMYGADGRLLIVSEPGTECGSQGWLYVDDAGKPVPTDRSMADLHRQLWQYTTHDGTIVGQGGKGALGEDPVIVVIDGKRRLLAEGQCRFIKFRKSGSLCSVAFVREDTGQSIMRWMTVDELRTLPEVPVPDPTSIGTSTPEPRRSAAAPKVDIRSYGSVIAAGQPWSLVIQNGDEVITVEKTAADSLHVEIRNPVGSDRSGQVRHVDVVGPAVTPGPPVDPIVKPVPKVTERKKVSFKTSTGQYLTINASDNVLVADAQDEGSSALFEITELGPSRVALKASNGKYVSAEDGGGRELVANRDAADAWETFTVVAAGSGIALQANNGLFVSPQNGGGGAVLANGPSAGAWEPLVPRPPLRSVVIPTPLKADGRIFRQDGRPWRWKGVSAFQLLNRFDRGEDIGAFLNSWGQKGANVLRVWPYVPVKDWKEKAWDAPRSHDTILTFLETCRTAGFYVELTLLLDDDPARIALAKQLLQVLTQHRPDNLLLEAANEPLTHKQIDTPALRSALAQSGFLYSSGDYEDSARFFGTFLTTHTGRTADWPRKAHDLLEFWEGGGPNARTDPAHKVPAVADEPIRPDEAQGDIERKVRDFYAYGAACALLGAGATFHMNSGKFATPPTDEEERCGEAMLAGLSVFPEDAPLGGYRRIVEPGNTDDQRTYVIGERYMVRVRPNSPTCPEPGWRSLDAYAIAWTR